MLLATLLREPQPMSQSIQPQTFGDIIIIRYDGMDADRHQIDMALLADSLRGFSRIIGVSGNFAATEKVILHKDAFNLKVVVTHSDVHCFSLNASLQWINQNPLITTVVGGLAVSLVTYICQRAAGNRAEMKQLRGALDTAIRELGHKDQPTIDRLLTTIDKMADGLRPAVRQAVAPVGQTAATVTIADVKSNPVGVFGSLEKEAIMSDSPTTVGEESAYNVLITEMDTETGSCKVSLDPSEPDRISARITDPAFLVPNNPYAVALAARSWLRVTAKPIIKDGEIDKLFISNSAE